MLIIDNSMDSNENRRLRDHDGVRVVNNVIYFFCEVSEKTSQKFMEILDTIPHQNLFVKMTSGGGDVSAGFAMYNAIQQARNLYVKTITTICEGGVRSAATIPFQAGNIRIMRPLSYYLMHPIRKGLPIHPTHKDIWDQGKNCDILIDMMAKIFCSDKLRRNEFEDMMGNEVILRPEQTWGYGLCDRIC